MTQQARGWDFKETQLNDRIESLNDALMQEREIREDWIKKYEVEQQTTSLHNLTSIELRAKL